MERQPFNICDGIVKSIIKLDNGTIIVDVFDNVYKNSLKKVYNFAEEIEFCEGESIDIYYYIVGKNINGRISGGIEFEFKTKELNQDFSGFKL